MCVSCVRAAFVKFFFVCARSCVFCVSSEAFEKKGVLDRGAPENRGAVHASRGAVGVADPKI